MNKYNPPEYIGKEYKQRVRDNKQNLHDLVRWLEYGRKSGYIASRQRKEQEEYWADELKDLLLMVSDNVKLGIWLHKEEDVEENYGWFVYLGRIEDKAIGHNISGTNYASPIELAIETAREIESDLKIPFVGVYDITVSEDEFQLVDDYKVVE